MRDQYRIVFQRFHPVGQGGLYSGAIVSPSGKSKFTWVYDCGTVQSQNLIIRELYNLQNLLITECPGPLDALCISHFDKDHISGITRLLEVIGAKKIFLPYLSLSFRLALLSKEKPDDPYCEFLLDPAAYLSSVGDDSEIVFVQGGREKPSQPDDPDQQQDFGDSDEFEARFPPGFEVTAQAFPLLAHQQKLHVAKVIRHDKPIRIGNFWEFIFYNEDPGDANLDDLETKVSQVLDRHKLPDGTYNLENLIEDLKKEYDILFGRGPVSRNKISLVLYGGSVRTSNGHQAYRQSGVRFGNQSSPFDGSSYQHRLPAASWRPLATLLTGDVFFNTPTRLDSAKSHFSAQRWRRIRLLQIPHHGSRHSWFTGASTYFPNAVKVICARSFSASHPHIQVLLDLGTTQRFHVNERKGLAWTMII